MKKCSTSLAIRKTHIKAIMRYHYMPTEVTKICLDIWIWSGASLPRYMIFVQHVLTRKWLTMGFRLDREGNKYKILGGIVGAGNLMILNYQIYECEHMEMLICFHQSIVFFHRVCNFYSSRIKKRVIKNKFNTFNAVYLYFFLRHSDCFPLMILKFKNRFWS